MYLEPLEGKVIAKPIGDKERTTKAGIIIAAKSVENMRFIQAEVIAAAKVKFRGDQEYPMHIKVGDIIIFDEYKAPELIFEGEKYYTVEEDKVNCIVRDYVEAKILPPKTATEVIASSKRLLRGNPTKKDLTMALDYKY